MFSLSWGLGSVHVSFFKARRSKTLPGAFTSIIKRDSAVSCLAVALRYCVSADIYSCMRFAYAAGVRHCHQDQQNYQ